MEFITKDVETEDSVERAPDYSKDGKMWLTEDFYMIPVGMCRKCKKQIKRHSERGVYHTIGLNFIYTYRNGYCAECCKESDDWDPEYRYIPVMIKVRE